MRPGAWWGLPARPIEQRGAYRASRRPPHETTFTTRQRPAASHGCADNEQSERKDQEKNLPAFDRLELDEGACRMGGIMPNPDPGAGLKKMYQREAQLPVAVTGARVLQAPSPRFKHLAADAVSVTQLNAQHPRAGRRVGVAAEDRGLGTGPGRRCRLVGGRGQDEAGERQRDEETQPAQAPGFFDARCRCRVQPCYFHVFLARSRTSMRTLSGIGVRACRVSASTHTHSSKCLSMAGARKRLRAA